MNQGPGRISCNAQQLPCKSDNVISISLYHIDGLVQQRRNSIANTLELRLSCNVCWAGQIWHTHTPHTHTHIYYAKLVGPRPCFNIWYDLLSYKFSKAWGLYFIWSLRTLTCVSAAMLLDSIEPSWQPETRVKFSSKTISHLRDFMGSVI